jgi:hypothetical protein
MKFATPEEDCLSKACDPVDISTAFMEITKKVIAFLE